MENVFVKYFGKITRRKYNIKLMYSEPYMCEPRPGTQIQVSLNDYSGME